MSATRRFLVGFVVAFCLATAGTASAYHTRFVEWDVQVTKSRGAYIGSPINKGVRPGECVLTATALPPPSHPTPRADSRVASRAGR